MTVGETKTNFTPSELADLLGGINLNTPVQAHQAVVATAILDARVVDKPSLARNLRVKLLTCGTAGQTDVMLKKIPTGEDGSAPIDMLNAPVVIDNADPDGTELESRDFVDEDTQKLEPGDLVYIEVDAAPTAGADLFVTANVDQRADPPTVEPQGTLIGGGTP